MMRIATGAAALALIVLAAPAVAQDTGAPDWRLGQHDGARATAYAFVEGPDGRDTVLIAGRLAQGRRVPNATATYVGTLLTVEVDCPGRRLKLIDAGYFGPDATPVGSGEGTDWLPITAGDQGLALNIAKSVCPGGRPDPVALAGADFAAAQRWLDATMAAAR